MNKIKKLLNFSKSKVTPDHIKINIKGQQVEDPTKQFNQNSFRDSINQAHTPQMFNLKVRIKIWGNLLMFFVYVYLIYRLMIYRLKADDLELMEREVKEEYEIKKRVNELKI